MLDLILTYRGSFYMPNVWKWTFLAEISVHCTEVFQFSGSFVKMGFQYIIYLPILFFYIRLKPGKLDRQVSLDWLRDDQNWGISLGGVSVYFNHPVSFPIPINTTNLNSTLKDNVTEMLSNCLCGSDF